MHCLLLLSESLIAATVTARPLPTLRTPTPQRAPPKHDPTKAPKKGSKEHHVEAERSPNFQAQSSNGPEPDPAWKANGPDTGRPALHPQWIPHVYTRNEANRGSFRLNDIGFKCKCT